MTYLEMARDENHGGGTWSFTNCLWAPTRKKNGTEWPFWSKVLQVRKDDLVLHLRGVPPNAYFRGYSVAARDGFETSRRPPDPGEWNFADTFYRADLTDFTPFHQPINLNDIFDSRNDELNSYFDTNKERGANKANIFLVRQSGRLQCLNGAYLSDIDEELLMALFGDGLDVITPATKQVVVSVETGSQISSIRSRLGQARFSSEIKKLYGNKCCFPSCNVSDTRFLVGSHIARWSDNQNLRGHMGNGMCLCLVHDRAFEIGLFTLDELYRVFVNPKERSADSQIVKDLLNHHGESIRLSDVKLLEDALLEHWIRVDIDPLT